MQPTFLNPYSIYDQNLRFSLPFIWPDQNFDILFSMTVAAGTVTLNVIYEGDFVDGLNDKWWLKVASSKGHTQLKTSTKRHPI